MSPSRSSDSPPAPQPGVPPRPPAEVRAALLALDRPGTPCTVRDGGPEGVDVVAEFVLVKLTKDGLFGRRQYCESFQVQLRLVPESYEVRAVDVHTEYTLSGDKPRRRTTSRSRGQLRKKLVGYEFTPGTRERRETYRFDSHDLKAALQHAVAAAGWTWRPVTFGRL